VNALQQHHDVALAVMVVGAVLFIAASALFALGFRRDR